MKTSEWPSRDDFVVVRIKRVMTYGAVVELSEYPGREGFIHISNIASSWVKNIHSFVSDGQVRVAQVINLDLSKKSIDLSLRKVSKQQEKTKLEDWKREKRADKMFERICRELKEPFNESYKKIAQKLAEEFGDLLSAFENASTSGESVLEPLGLPEKWKKAILAYAVQNIAPQKVSVKGRLSLSCKKGDGFLIIKKALEQLKQPDVTVIYISAPVYQVEVTAGDYDEAEKKLKAAVDAASSALEKSGGESSFERIKN